MRGWGIGAFALPDRPLYRWVTALTCLAAGVPAAASPFTETSPTSFGTLPDGLTPVGGIVIDLAGANGSQVFSQVAASDLSVGMFASSPGLIGTQSGYTNAVINSLGGGITEAAFRITLFDGDNAAGEFDANQNRLLVDGVDLGDWTAVNAQATDGAGDATADGFSGGGFRNNILDTGWFFTDDTADLAALYAALTADGELAIELTDVDPNDNFFDFTQGIDAALAGGSIVPTVIPLADIIDTSSPTQGQVAAILDDARGGSTELATLVDTIDALPSDDAKRGAMDAVVPRVAHAQVEAAVGAMRTQAFNIDSRLNALRRRGLAPAPGNAPGSAPGPGHGGVSLTSSDDPFGFRDAELMLLSVDEPAGGDAAATAPANDDAGVLAGLGAQPGDAVGSMGFYALGSATLGDLSATDDQIGGDFTGGGLTVGVDRRWTRRLAAGAAIGVAMADTDFSDGGELSSETLSLSAYGTWFISDAFHADAMVAYGYNDLEIDRRIVFAGTDETATADTDGHTLAAKARLTYRHRVGPLTLAPTAEARYAKVWIDGYTEEGAGALNLTIGDQESDSLISSLGGTVTLERQLGGLTVAPFVGGAWEHEFLDDARLISAAFASNPGSPFTTPTDNPDRDYFTLTGGVTVVTDDGWTWYADYQGAFGNDDYESHTIRAGVRLPF